MENLNSKDGQFILEDLPNQCPHCHRSIKPNLITGHLNESFNRLEVMFFCPHVECANSFLAYYSLFNTEQAYFMGVTSEGTLKHIEFSDSIKELSENFSIIYNQAKEAEDRKLDNICGVGYRKALEFLVKDYAIQNNPDDASEIKSKLLGQCINKYVDDPRIKKVVKRAVWLGNDETHYERRWVNKDLSDLKKLIDLVVHWIEMEIITDEIEIDMPD